MATIRNHGGGCCGMRHYAGFSASEETNPGMIVDQVRDGYNYGRMSEVVLNRTQCIRSPRTLEMLANMGFVLTTRFMNDNSNNECFIFHRVDHRLSIEPTALPFQWTGQIITPGLHGDLPHLPRGDFTRAGRAPPAAAPRRFNGFMVGCTVRVNTQASRWNGQDFTITRINPPSWDRIWHTACGFIDGRRVEISVSNLTMVRDVANPPALRAPAGPPFGEAHRHQQPDAAPFQVAPAEAAPVPAEPVVPEEPRVVWTTYHNVYRVSGRSSGWPTLALARQHGANATRIDRLEAMSNGETFWTENVR